MSNREKTQKIRDFILDKVGHYPKDISIILQRKFDLTKQGAYYHLKKLVDDGFLDTEGKRKAKSYKVKPIQTWTKVYDLEGLQEHLVWDEVLDLDLLPVLNPDKAGFTLNYGFTEMLNNAIDHSEGTVVAVLAEVYYQRIRVVIMDDGVGIFKKIQREENLENEREAILLLSKGKYTSNPEKHTGQGIFFTSKAFDFFDILSGDLCFIHELDSHHDWILDQETHGQGTMVVMELAINSELNMGDLFDQFTSDDGEYEFDTTIVPVRKLKTSTEGLVSRSQAKRLMFGLHKFEQIRLDFDKVNMIGQSFADEVFRVWRHQNPGKILHVINANKEVENMINRVHSTMEAESENSF